MLGKLLLAVGEDNVLWGTDAIWYGSPQPAIDAFRAFQIPADLRERYGYPELTPQREGEDPRPQRGARLRDRPRRRTGAYRERRARLAARRDGRRSPRAACRASPLTARLHLAVCRPTLESALLGDRDAIRRAREHRHADPGHHAEPLAVERDADRERDRGRREIEAPAHAVREQHVPGEEHREREDRADHGRRDARERAGEATRRGACAPPRARPRR